MARFEPADAAQAREAVAWAAAEGEPLAVVSGGTKRALGRPMQVPHELALGRLAGIVDYEPSELVLTARAATPLSDIRRVLAQRGQELAFEPCAVAPLGAAGEPTLGGVVGCNLSGPRRLRAGAARDHVLGVAAVTGRGEAVKAGGKVVKNVTGYDLPKLFTGSYGTLAVLTEITVKVMPAAEKLRTILVFGLPAGRAVALLGEAVGSPLDVTGAAYLPPAIAARSGVAHVAGARASVAALRVEGPPSSTLVRAAALRERVGAAGPVEELHGTNSRRLWDEVGSAALLAEPAGRLVWRLGLPPAAAAGVVEGLLAGIEGSALYDWAGARVWLALANREAAVQAARVRAAVAAAGGTALLVRAPEALRETLDVFDPEPPSLAGLTRRVKQAFDPKGVLNPGRMHAGL